MSVKRETVSKVNKIYSNIRLNASFIWKWKTSAVEINGKNKKVFSMRRIKIQKKLKFFEFIFFRDFNGQKLLQVWLDLFGKSSIKKLLSNFYGAFHHPVHYTFACHRPERNRKTFFAFKSLTHKGSLQENKLPKIG